MYKVLIKLSTAPENCFWSLLKIIFKFNECQSLLPSLLSLKHLIKVVPGLLPPPTQLIFFNLYLYFYVLRSEKETNQ